VSQIQDLTENDLWRYISTKQNPRDLVSRGISSKQLENLSVWWNGPSFLSELHYEFPPQPQIQEDPVDFKKEVRRVTLMSTSQIENRIPIEKFSSLIKLKRVTAYCLRFVNNMRRSKEQRQNGPLTLNEITTATNELIKIAQRGSFSEEINQLEQNKPLRTKSKLLSLNPFLHDGILRVGGRLSNSQYDFHKKHPAILPHNHRLTKLILEHEHRALFHAGPQLLLSQIRNRFWPISGRNLVKQRVRNCVTCFKANPKPMQ
jgi:hypothetical protein